MKLTRHQTPAGARWAFNDHLLESNFDFGALLESPLAAMRAVLESQSTPERARGDFLPPLEPNQEVWASGVTYQRSRAARQAESALGDVYDRVYVAQRPELFYKAIGWRVIGSGQPLRIRRDSHWNVPEPELALVINCHQEIVGYTAGNDMSSRSIEGQNPLYLPQAKIYDASCALGPSIQLQGADSLRDLPIEMAIERLGQVVFQGSTSTANMNRKFEGLVDYLFRELSFPRGVFLLTGTGIVPPDHFTIIPGDRVTVKVGDISLVNEIAG